MKRLQEGEQWSALIDYTILAAGYVQVSFTKLTSLLKAVFLFRIRIQEGKSDPEKQEKIKKFYVLKCWMFSFVS